MARESHRAAVERWRTRQKQLLAETYSSAWLAGVQSYTPDPDPPRDSTPDDFLPVAAGASAVALTLALRRAKKYVAPSAPDPAVQARALSAASASADKMAAEMAAIVASPENLAAAQAAADAGAIGASDISTYAVGLAFADWADSNAWRLDGGDSVAWAAEQNGYAQAADADGQLLEWVTEEDDAVCADCSDLGGLPPMPASDWPTQPGSGDTDCDVGCRCTMDAVEGSDLPELSPNDGAVIDRIAQSVEPAMPAVAQLA